MDWNDFTPIAAALGGALIGAASLMLLLFNGRTAGVSGIAGGVLRFNLRDLDWRLAFLGGLIIAPVGWGLLRGGMPVVEITGSIGLLIAGGLLVGCFYDLYPIKIFMNCLGFRQRQSTGFLQSPGGLEDPGFSQSTGFAI